MKKVTVIGAGLSGCEAALQLAKYGCRVRLFDCKPTTLLNVYSQQAFGELICSNSLGGMTPRTPKGLLLNELHSLGSILISIADKCRVDDSAFFAVDKQTFSTSVTSQLIACGVELYSQIVSMLPADDYVILATGALTNAELMEDLSRRFGITRYSFADASCPIIDIRTIDLKKPQIKKLSPDLYMIEVSIGTAGEICQQLIKCAKKSSSKHETFDSTYNSLETIESVAFLGVPSLIKNKLSSGYSSVPHVLLRRENAFSNGFIVDRWTTTLRHSEQVKTITMLPGMETCKFIKYGRMHRNSFINSPDVLDEFYNIKKTNTFVIGQLSGVDDYAAAIASGWVAAQKIIHGRRLTEIPPNTMIGGLSHYVSNQNTTDFQPMCPAFELMNCESSNYWAESSIGIQKLLQAIS